MLPIVFVKASQLTAQQMADADRAAEGHRQRAAAAATAEGLTPASARPAVSAPMPVHLHQSAAVAEGGQMKRRRVYGLTPQISSGGGGSGSSGLAEAAAAAGAAEAEAAPAATAMVEPAASAVLATASDLKEVDGVPSETAAVSDSAVGSKRKAHAVDEQTARSDADQPEGTADQVSLVHHNVQSCCSELQMRLLPCLTADHAPAVKLLLRAPRDQTDLNAETAAEVSVDEQMLPEVEEEIEEEADKEVRRRGQLNSTRNEMQLSSHGSLRDGSLSAVALCTFIFPRCSALLR